MNPYRGCRTQKLQRVSFASYVQLSAHPRLNATLIPPALVVKGIWLCFGEHFLVSSKQRGDNLDRLVRQEDPLSNTDVACMRRG